MSSKSDQIKFEAFHVFKVFVANPRKSREVHSLLYANKNGLIDYLQKHHKNKTDDPQFVEEKMLLINTLKDLPPVKKTIEKSTNRGSSSFPATADAATTATATATDKA